MSAYDLGRRAYRAGKRLIENPYVRDTQDWRDFRRGWQFEECNGIS